MSQGWEGYGSRRLPQVSAGQGWQSSVAGGMEVGGGELT